jgi:hypothetical protein
MNDSFSKIQFSKYFILSTGIILGLTGMAKVWSGLGTAKVLAAADPVTGVMFGHLMVSVGIVEFIIALFCFISKSLKMVVVLVAWLATSLMLYRFGLWWIDFHKPCSCLGNLTDALHIPPQTADTAMKIILGYLLIGSYISLFWLWCQHKKLLQPDVLQ